jgi:hypothetical protein
VQAKATEAETKLLTKSGGYYYVKLQENMGKNQNHPKPTKITPASSQGTPKSPAALPSSTLSSPWRGEDLPVYLTAISS